MIPINNGRLKIINYLFFPKTEGLKPINNETELAETVPLFYTNFLKPHKSELVKIITSSDNLSKEQLISSESFNAYLDLVGENAFESEVSYSINKKNNDISPFHFAVSSMWQNKGSAVVDLTEENLYNWLNAALNNIRLQLQYCFS